MKGKYRCLTIRCCQSILICIVLLLQTFSIIADPSTQEPDEVIKIGILVPDKGTTAAINGAELAIKEANIKGGINGTPLTLMTRSMEGPWGTGSKQAIDLIFREKVWSLFGSHDGRNAHLVEQAATKAQVVFVSAWSGDPTLSQAFVPWFYNCVPNDIQQAETLVNEIYTKRKLSKVVIISDNEYDSNLAMVNFIRVTGSTVKNEPLQLIYDNFENTSQLIEEVKKYNPDAIVIFCKPSYSIKIKREIREQNIVRPLFGYLGMMNEDELTHEELDELYNDIIITSSQWSRSLSTAFNEKYLEVYGEIPGMVAAYAYDGMSVIIEAIKTAGSREREKIQKVLSEISYNGVTGKISFDDMGNRTGPYYPVKVVNGFPVREIE